MSKLTGRRGDKPRLHGLARGEFYFSLRAFFCCLKQDGQDEQDLQDGPLGHPVQRSGRP